MATVIRLRSRLLRSGCSHTSPNRTSSRSCPSLGTNSYTVGFFCGICRSPRAWFAMAMRSKDIRDAGWSPVLRSVEQSARLAPSDLTDRATPPKEEARLALREAEAASQTAKDVLLLLGFDRTPGIDSRTACPAAVWQCGRRYRV